MKSLDDNESARLSKPTGMDGENGESRSGVIGNERLTALAGAVLLVLILLELVSSANLHALLPLHIFVGVFLAGPLVVKLGSTSYRFVRYYTKSPAYVRSGPPRLPVRALSPLLLVTTLAVVGSGIEKRRKHMQPPFWQPPVDLSKQEEQVVYGSPVLFYHELG
jgi:hypothetical protein